MNRDADYIQKIKLSATGAWMATLLVAVLGFDLLKKTIILLLAKIYEWLLELNPFRT